jgi:hypothetical protein
MQMKDLVSFIIPIRDRPSSALERQIKSLRENGCDPCFLVIDYGSTDFYKRQYEDLCRTLDLGYERMSTEGLPWNKCRAINRGVKLATTEYIVTSDVDMLYSSDPLPYCLQNFAEKTIYHIDTYWLPKDGNRGKARYAGKGSSGGFVFTSASAFKESGGYDERMEYWGQEDLDWPSRLQGLGYRREWLPETHKLFHQWHSSSENSARRPFAADYNTMRYCAENAMKPVLSQEWGQAVLPKDRPILQHIEKGEPFVIELDIGELAKFEGVRKICRSSGESAFVLLRFGSRLVHRPLSALAEPVMAFLRPATAITGISCACRTNRNFDFFYAILPALLKRGLLDYFISPDTESAYLLWEIEDTEGT